MENFARSIKDLIFKEILLNIFSRPKPFQNFKRQVDASNFREDWFEFKRQAYIEWVKEQIEFEEEE